MNKSIEVLVSELNAIFPERRPIILGSIAAVLSSEHVLLIGPPGTAKSALVRSIAQAFGGIYFERLLTKHSTPEELFGPISLKSLENDRFCRVTSGKLPEAEFAFADEIFKSGSSILNSLLTILNERLFHNDGAPVRCPLVSLFGASNELPTDARDAEALYDRFLIRFEVPYILRPANMKLILTSQEPALMTRLTMNDLRAAQLEVAQVKVTDPTIEAMLSIRAALQIEGVVASDRRWKKSIKLVKAMAWLNGSTETCPEDLAVLVDGLWRETKDRSRVARCVGRLADPISTQAQEIVDAARETAQKVSTIQNVGDRKDYITEAAGALREFTQQQSKLNDLAKSAGSRAKANINDALIEIKGLHAEMARAVSHGLGLGTGMRAVK